MHCLYELILAPPHSALAITWMLCNMLLPLMLLCVAVVGEGVKHGRANGCCGCGDNTGASPVMVAEGAAAAAVGT
jgi:hypothetical protein